ncbi:hypothetical protein BGZ68_007109 [Mortierella alpina]|nr:hypothetical protein BGZ68_007109 [Mortierella alpina]
MSNPNDFYAPQKSSVGNMLRYYWRTKRPLFLIPAILFIWSLSLLLSMTSTDPEFSFERGFHGEVDLSKATLDRNPTKFKPILLKPLPEQSHVYQWPPNIRFPLCMPKIFVYPDSIKMGEFQVSDTPSVGTNYIAEQILLKQLRDKTSDVYKNYVTENPEEADFFYIPFLGSKYLADCWFAQGQKGDCDVDEKYAEPMMNHIQQDHPYWNRTYGKDHIITHPMDRTARYYKSQSRMQNATFLTTVGDRTRPDRSTRFQDIVIPSATSLLNLAFENPMNYLTADGHPKSGTRNIFVLFGGIYKDVKPDDQYSAGVRSLLLGFSQQPDYKVAAGWDYSTYAKLLATSKYGFAPQGWTLDTTRIWEYIAFGVVPIVIADGIIEPFENDLDWDSFIVRIPRKDAHRMDVILRSISAEEYEAKRQALWDHGRQSLLDHDAWNLIVRDLCRRAGLEGMRTVGPHVHVKLGSDVSV